MKPYWINRKLAFPRWKTLWRLFITLQCKRPVLLRRTSEKNCIKSPLNIPVHKCQVYGSSYIRGGEDNYIRKPEKAVVRLLLGRWCHHFRRRNTLIITALLDCRSYRHRGQEIEGKSKSIANVVRKVEGQLKNRQDKKRERTEWEKSYKEKGREYKKRWNKRIEIKKNEYI